MNLRKLLTLKAATGGGGSIPIGVELIDYTSAKIGYIVNSDGSEETNEWCSCSDYTHVDDTMTYDYICYRWYRIVLFDENKNRIGRIYSDTDAVIDENDNAHGTLTPDKFITGTAYIRMSAYSTTPNSTNLSLIRTA